MMSKPSHFTKQTLALAVSTVVGLGINTAIAEEGSWALEEVVVTAQKREQSLQDVPISVSAFSGEMMKNAQINDAKEIALLTPGVSGDSPDSFMDSINIRGISTNGFGVGAEPSVGIYLNGIYLGRTGGAVTSMFDMDRVEVVKGPQGTLFGRNASAGAISMHTRRANQEQGGSIDIGLGEDGYQQFTGVYNLPITDELAARVAIHTREQDGFMTNVVDGKEVGAEDVSAVRVSFAYETDALSADLILEYEDREVSPSIYKTYGRDAILDDDEFESDIASNRLIDEGEVWGATLNVEMPLGDDYSLTSITGIRGHNYYYAEDFDGYTADTFFYGQTQEQKYYSQEFRLSYEGDGPVSWFVGTSAYREDIEASFDQTYDEDQMCATASVIAYGYDPAAVFDCNSLYEYWYGPGYGYGPGIGQRNDRVDANGDYEGWGVYGDATFALTEKLDMTVGARYTEDSRDFGTKFGGQDRNYFWYSFPFFSQDYVEGGQAWENLSARVAFNLEINESISTFLNVSTGYKAGGFNTFSLNIPGNLENVALDDDGASVDANTIGATLSEFDEEEVISYELGMKSRWWDDRMQFNASIYRYDFEGMQTVYNIGPQVYLANAGDSTGQGIEMDLRVLPTENLDIYVGLAWSDTELSDPDADFCVETDCKKGGRLPGSVDFSSALVATYSIPLDSGEAYITLENFYQSETTSFGDYTDTLEAASVKETNLRIGFTSADGWAVSLWGNNLTDEWHEGSPVASDGYNLPGHYVGMGPSPRRFGVDLSMEF